MLSGTMQQHSLTMEIPALSISVKNIKSFSIPAFSHLCNGYLHIEEHGSSVSPTPVRTHTGEAWLPRAGAGAEAEVVLAPAHWALASPTQAVPAGPGFWGCDRGRVLLPLRAWPEEEHLEAV